MPDLPTAERPRDKLLADGAETLTEAELLAVLLRHGVAGASALDLARSLLVTFGSLRELTDRFAVSYEELLPYVKAAYAMRWDVPEDVYPARPRTYGSGASRLMEIVSTDHHGLRLDAGPPEGFGEQRLDFDTPSGPPDRDHEGRAEHDHRSQGDRRSDQI